jgi:hypothetical protein
MRVGDLNRQEAIALLSELGNNQLVDPNFVLLEIGKLNSYQLKIKGIYDINNIDMFLKKNKLSCKENKDYLIISEP